MSPVELPSDAAEPWKDGFKDTATGDFLPEVSQFFLDLDSILMDFIHESLSVIVFLAYCSALSFYAFSRFGRLSVFAYCSALSFFAFCSVARKHLRAFFRRRNRRKRNRMPIPLPFSRVRSSSLRP